MELLMSGRMMKKTRREIIKCKENYKIVNFVRYTPDFQRGDVKQKTITKIT